MRLSLKLKLIVLMVALLGATVLASYIIFDRSGEALLQQVVEHIKSVESFGNTIEIQQLLTKDNDVFSIEQTLSVRMGQHGKIAQVSILDASQRVIASSNQEDVGITLRELQQRRVLEGKQFLWGTLLREHLKKYDVTFPLLTNTWEKRYLNVIFVMNDLEYLIKRAKYSNMFWIVSFFAGGTLIAIVLVTRFTRPIDQLVVASKAVARGDFDTTVPVKSGDEFETLLTGFNEMTQHLKAHKALEERFRRAERMAALGELGARLAHEIRNPLHSISLIIDHIRDRFMPVEGTNTQKLDQYISNIKTELKRLNTLVSDFLQVSRPSRPDRRVIQVYPLFTQIRQFLEHEAIKHHVQCTVHVNPEDLTVTGDENLLKTALLNIALNAIQAMQKSGGHLRIHAQTRYDSENEVNVYELVVADTGPGIPTEHQQKIFEPYFTTKEEGTGLGLAIVNRIVADHHGAITVESQPGKGTTITILLPTEVTDK
jgi:signal transduction histidine kinase